MTPEEPEVEAELTDADLDKVAGGRRVTAGDLAKPAPKPPDPNPRNALPCE